MPKSLGLLCCLALLSLHAAAQVGPAGAPAPQDIPQPVAGDVGLAGAACPDIERYLNVRAAAAPSLSPDGTRLAYRTSVTGQPQVWVVETRGGAAPQQITFGESVTFHDWSPEGEWIVYGVDRGGNEREGFYLIAPDGTRERELLPPSEAFRAWGGFSRDGRYAAYAATEEGGDDFSIYTINLRAEEIRPLRVYAGRGGVYFAGWRPDTSGLLLTRTRGEDSNDVLYLDLATGTARALFEPREAARYDSFSWTPDGRGFYLATNQGREFAGLAYYDVGARRLDWVETPERDVEQVTLSRDGRYLAWTENHDGFSDLRLRDLRAGRTYLLSAAEPRRGDVKSVQTGELFRAVVNSLDWAAGAPRLAVQLSGPQVPGDIWALDPTRLRAGSTPTAGRGFTAGARAAAVTRVTQSSLAGLDSRNFVIPEAVSLPSHDGVTIYGLLYLPRGATPGARPPVVLNVHGGPTAQARPGFSPVHQYLLARGYAVFDLNFRGSTGFGKRFARLDNGRLRPGAVKDMAAAVDWLAASERRVDARRAAVMGGSYGGYLTFAALAQLPDKFRAGVSFVGVSNWVTALAGASPQLKASDRVEYGDVDDPSDREFFRELSPLTHVANVRAPLLVSHGANDPRDPVAEADQMVSAIRGRGGDVEYLRFPDEGHGIRKLSNRVIAYRRVALFLERTLGPGVADCAAGAPAAARVDEFGGVPCGDELARLDNLAGPLRADPTSRAYIVVYGPRAGRSDVARRRALRMKSYFVRERGLDPSRIVAVDGGRRAELRAELWLAPAGAPAPVPDAVLRAGRVEHKGSWARVGNCEDTYRGR